MPLAPLDTAAAAAFWATFPEAAGASCTVERFGDSPRLADELLDLVQNGTKRATATLAAEFAPDEFPRIGTYWIVCDSAGAPRVILRTTELRLVPFRDVDADFAYDEGEDDRTLASWQAEHRRYFERRSAALTIPFTDDTLVLLERFRVVHPPKFADQPGGC
ncbi:ASCH domain-containing protein [Symbioplanes lichenis]|uniref:ASCH domain-containing protein n=1 Tax=Symbioplanes lichenis TaxID=1629072 RepID=UPI002739AA48|nr:ASCH domain-containing protein [Actinoplanes lichenis]